MEKKDNRKATDLKKIPPQLLIDSLNPATRLLEQRRKMYEVQEAYEREKKEFAKKEEIFKQREEQLRARDVEIQESLVRFSKFLQENEAKKIRNQNRMAQEEAELKKKDEELKQKEVEHSQLKTQLEGITKTVSVLKKYQEFLEEVKRKHQEEFKEVEDILSRCSTLKLHKDDMANSKTSLEKEIEQIKQAVRDNSTYSEQKILNLEASISSLRTEIEQRDKQKQDKQKEMTLLSKKTVGTTAELGQLIMSIENIANRCKSRIPGKKGATFKLSKDIATSDFTKNVDIAKKQLIDVDAFIEDYKRIIMELNQEKKAAAQPLSKAK